MEKKCRQTVRENKGREREVERESEREREREIERMGIKRDRGKLK